MKIGMERSSSLKNTDSEKGIIRRTWRRSFLIVLSLIFLLDAGSAMSEELVTVSSTQKLRKRGSPRSKSIGKMVPGKRAILIKNYRHWSLVSYNGKRGFVPKSSLVAAEDDYDAKERDDRLDLDRRGLQEIRENDGLEADYCPFCLSTQHQDPGLRDSNPIPSSLRELADRGAASAPGDHPITINVTRSIGSRTRIQVLTRFLEATHEEAVKPRKTSRSVRRATGRKYLDGNRSKGMCYQAVKEALVDSGMTKHYLPGGHAYEAHTKGYLKRAGFDNYIGRYSAFNAPPGCVLVYKGGRSGHIETRTRGGYCSDFCSKSPISTRLPRRLVGVYCK